MTKKIIYWIATLWAALGMTATGIVQVLGQQAKVEYLTHMVYPGYFYAILGSWKLLGVIAILLPGWVLLKEWAYAGFFFLMTGAIFSHLAIGDPFKEIWPSLLLLVLILVSWYYRPAKRKLAILQQKRIP